MGSHRVGHNWSDLATAVLIIFKISLCPVTLQLPARLCSLYKLNFSFCLNTIRKAVFTDYLPFTLQPHLCSLTFAWTSQVTNDLPNSSHWIPSCGLSSSHTVDLVFFQKCFLLLTFVVWIYSYLFFNNPQFPQRILFSDPHFTCQYCSEFWPRILVFLFCVLTHLEQTSPQSSCRMYRVTY